MEDEGLIVSEFQRSTGVLVVFTSSPRKGVARGSVFVKSWYLNSRRQSSWSMLDALKSDEPIAHHSEEEMAAALEHQK